MQVFRHCLVLSRFLPHSLVQVPILGRAPQVLSRLPPFLQGSIAGQKSLISFLSLPHRHARIPSYMNRDWTWGTQKVCTRKSGEGRLCRNMKDVTCIGLRKHILFRLHKIGLNEKQVVWIPPSYCPLPKSDFFVYFLGIQCKTLRGEPVILHILYSCNFRSKLFALSSFIKTLNGAVAWREERRGCPKTCQEKGKGGPVSTGCPNDLSQKQTLCQGLFWKLHRLWGFGHLIIAARFNTRVSLFS